MSPLERVPFTFPKHLDPIVLELRDNILEGPELLEIAVQQALKANVPQMTAWGILSAKAFLRFASGMLRWVPSENFQGKSIYVVLTLFGFIFQQPVLQHLQSPIDPQSIGKPHTPLSDWLVRYAKALGAWMDSPESLTTASYITFGLSPKYNLHEAIAPAGGFKTFNDLFARRLKPGARPISNPSDDQTIVHAADSTFGGDWSIGSNNEVIIKHLPWSIEALLDGSEYAPKYKSGVWMHSFLNTFDYHRQHAPVSGRVVEAKIVPGLCYLQVQAVNGVVTPRRDWQRTVHTTELDAPNDPGYQFLQARGCITIDNPVLGYVTILPVGMAQVSSVNLLVEEGQWVEKGDEISNFYFGGSDIVLVFEEKAQIEFAVNVDTHYRVGERLAISKAV